MKRVHYVFNISDIITIVKDQLLVDTWVFVISILYWPPNILIFFHFHCYGNYFWSVEASNNLSKKHLKEVRVILEGGCRNPALSKIKLSVVGELHL